LTDADYDRLYDLGLSQAEVYEIVATTNLFVSVNQYTDAIGLEIDKL
jgi:hypothetical protein